MARNENTPAPSNSAQKSRAYNKRNAGHEDIRRITEIVLNVLRHSADDGPVGVHWISRFGSWVVERWAFILSVVAALTLIGASVIYGASPLFYLRQIAAEDRKLDAAEQKRNFELEMSSRSIKYGNALLDQGLFEDARSAFDEALGLNPYSVEAGVGRIKASLFDASKNRQFDRAVIAARICFSFAEGDDCNLRDVHAITALADLAASGGDGGSAASYYEKSLSTRETSYAHHGRGLVAYQSGDYAKSANELLRAVALSPERIEFRVNLASAFLALGQKDNEMLDRAISELQIISERDKENLSHYVEYAFAYRWKGMIDESNQIMQYAIELSENADLMRLPKNAGPWVFVIGDSSIWVGDDKSKIMFLKYMRSLGMWLIGDQKDMIELEKASPEQMEIIDSALGAEIALIRERGTAFQKSIDASTLEQYRARVRGAREHQGRGN